MAKPRRCITLDVVEAATRAFTQACREAGISPHPGGRCPGDPCPCRDPEVGDWVENRAEDLARQLLGAGTDR